MQQSNLTDPIDEAAFWQMAKWLPGAVLLYDDQGRVLGHNQYTLEWVEAGTASVQQLSQLLFWQWLTPVQQTNLFDATHAHSWVVPFQPNQTPTYVLVESKPIQFVDKSKFFTLFCKWVPQIMPAQKPPQLLEEWVDLATHSAGIGIWDQWLETGETIWSSSMYELFGRQSADQLDPVSIFQQSILPEDMENEYATYARAVAKGERYETEFRIQRPDQQVRYLRAVGKIIRHDNGAPYRMIGANWDITEAKLAAESLIAKNTELTGLKEELEQFIYKVSHDLKAPLNSVSGIIQIIRIDADAQKLEEYLGLIEKSIRGLNMYIQELAQVTYNNRAQMRPELVDFQDLLTTLLGQFAFMENRERISVDIDVVQSGDFYTDRACLQAVLNNLVSNAIKYANLGLDQPYALVKVEANDYEAVIVVEDNGIGISEGAQQKVFDLFYRAVSHVPGSGLGLHIVKGAVQKMGGNIRLQSTLGKGSRFTVVIPNSPPSPETENTP